MTKGYSPFWDTEKEVVIRDSMEFYITDMQEKVYEVYGEEHQVLTVYFNAYMENDGVDRWNRKQYGKDYYEIVKYLDK